MARRIEIELTSKLSDSEWTWRAAGARQPKGTLDASVLYGDAKAGDVVRAEAEFEIDGITILSVSPPLGKRNEPDNRIEITGPKRKFEPVTSALVPKKPKGERRKGKEANKGSGEGRKGPREGSGRPDRSGDNRRPRRERPETGSQRTPSIVKLTPKDVHRKRVLEEVPVEQRPIAEQVLRRGLPAVREAIDAENKKAKTEGRPEINGPALMSLAEQLLPRLKAAEWMDRAEAARENVDQVGMRDLRAVVGSADAVARTEEARLLASELREALERRTVKERETWTSDISTALDENRIVRALRLSSRPPDPEAKFTPELLERLRVAAGEAMSPETPKERWTMLLDAVAASPVRRSVEPVGLPTDAGEELVETAKQVSGRIPALAKMLGVTMPPPPRRLPPKPPRIVKPGDESPSDPPVSPPSPE